MVEHVVDLSLPAGDSYNPLDLRAALPSGFISGYIWNDANGDGIQQAIEPTFAGVAVLIQKGACGANQSVPVAALSDVNGIFRFSELYAGTYCVSIDSQSGSNAAILGAGAWTTANARQITVRPVSEENVNFGWRAQ